MHIVCPNCTTSYAVNADSFGDTGRNVRCARCKQVWLAHPENLARAVAPVPEMAASVPSAAAKEDSSAWGVSADEVQEHPGLQDQPHLQEQQVPLVESPSISADWPAEANENADWVATTQQDTVAKPAGKKRAPRRRPLKPAISFRMPIGLNAACAGMAALVMALIFWRTDVVRLMPQTASFYRLVGLNVNLRALAFKDLKVTTETVDGKPVLVIEGVVVGESRKPVELPRLRFIVRDSNGTEIYAWNAVLEQPVLNPGERAWFRSRLASPPVEGRAIDVRFFNKRDIGA